MGTDSARVFHNEDTNMAASTQLARTYYTSAEIACTVSIPAAIVNHKARMPAAVQELIRR